MNREQYRALLRQFDYTQEGFADLLGVHHATGRRWAQIGVNHVPTVVLLRLLQRGKITIKQIIKARRKM